MSIDNIYQSTSGQYYKKMVDTTDNASAVSYAAYNPTPEEIQELNTLYPDGEVPQVSDQQLLLFSSTTNLSVIFSAITSTLTNYIPDSFQNLSDEDVSVLIAQVTAALKDVQDKLDKGQINLTKEQQNAINEKRRDAITESENKMKEAQAERDKMKGWDIAKMAIQFILAIGSIIAGAILMASGAGAAVGILMVTSGALGLMSAINSVVAKTNDGHGILALFILKCNPNCPEDVLSKAEMGVAIYVTIMSIVLGVGMGAASLAGSVANAADKAATAAEAAEAVAGTIQTVANYAMTISAIMDVIANVTTAVGDTAAAVINFNATKTEADAKGFNAKATRNQAEVAILEDFMDQILSRLAKRTDIFNNVLDSIIDDLKDRGQILSNARLTA